MAEVLKIGSGGVLLHPERSRSSMDRMTDSGSVGWAFESPRDHEEKRLKGRFFIRDTMQSKVKGDENAKGRSVRTERAARASS